MSSSFSTITGLNPSTISRQPTYTAPAASEAKPQASTPIVVTTDYKHENQNSHWFLKTIAAAAVIAGGLVAGRKYIPQLKDISTEAMPTTGTKDKVLYYVAKAGDEIEKFAVDMYNKVKGLFDRSQKTPPANA